MASESLNSQGLFDITQFLDGRTVAHGIFEDRFGRVRRRFSVTMDGTWAGDQFTLAEAFLYDDGERETRVWHIVRGAHGEFRGQSEDCIGGAKGTCTPESWTLRYQFRLRMKSRTLAVSCDDRVYRMTDHVALNRVTVRKWGIRLGEITITFERQPAGAPEQRSAA